MHVRRLELPLTLQSLDVSTSGRLSFTCQDSQRTLAAGDGIELELPRRQDHFFYSSLASADGSRLYVTDARDKRLVAVHDGREAWSVPGNEQAGNLRELVETPEGNIFFSGANFAKLLSPEGDVLFEGRSDRFQAHTGHCSLLGPDHSAYLGGIDGLEKLGGWFTPSPPGHVISELAASSTTLYAAAFGSQLGLLLALDPETGRELWRHPTGFNRAMAPAVMSDGRVLAADQEGRLSCLSPDGKLLWSLKLDAPTAQTLFSEPLEKAVPTSPTLDEKDNVYIGYGRTMLCFQSDGTPLGRIELPAAQEPCQRPRLAPDGTLYVHDGDQSVMILDAPALLAIQREQGAASVKVEGQQVLVGGVRLPVRKVSRPV
ncbi:hypothetical protein DYH09_08815 [bacterium CPR1]|nr:hypothetical protein [bacterium CPR1]